MKKLSKMYREMLETADKKEARRIRRDIRRLVRKQRDRRELLPSQQGCGYGGMEEIDHHYKWEDWN